MPKDFYKTLISTHPDHDHGCEYWKRLTKLTAGGRSVGIEEKSKLLVNPASREKDIIEARAKVATYEPVMGTIVLKMVSQLLRDESIYTGSDDPYWNEKFFPMGTIDPKAPSGRVGFHRFLTMATYQALTQGMAIAQVDTPSTPEARNLAEQRAMGGNEPYLILRDRGDLWDYCTSEKGFEFVKLHSYHESKKSWDDPLDRCHEFLIYERQSNNKVWASCYEVRLMDDEDGKKPFGDRDLHLYTQGDIRIETKFEKQEIFNLGDRFEFPVITMEFNGAMWLADQLENLQVAQFNTGASGDWANYSTNYAMPVVTMADGSQGQHFNDNPLRFFKMGNGHFLELKPGMRLDWFQRDVAGIKLAYDREAQYRQRMFDYINQISSIVAAGYLHQSGESKKEDRRALDILLEVYGQRIKEFAQQVLEVAAIAHGEIVDWTIQGFSDYDSETLEESLAEYLAIDQAGIDSPTLRKEAQKVIARRYGSEYGLDDKSMDVVVEELDQSPFHLTVQELAAVTELIQGVSNGIPPQLALGLLKASNYLPDYLFDAAVKAFEEMGYGEEPEEMEESEEMEDEEDNGETKEENEGDGESDDVEGGSGDND